jgi:hypothetical protein
MAGMAGFEMCAVYLAEEMAVVYPGVRTVTQNILGVLDVAEHEDDQRMAWVVLDERKGVDLVIGPAVLKVGLV